MLEWKAQSAGESALLIEGPRRVGKSTITKLFAQREYRTHIVIDFAKASTEEKNLFNDLSDMDYFFTRLKQFTSEDWIIVFVGAAVLVLACIFPGAMPSMPKKLLSAADWISAVEMFGFVLILTYVTLAALRKPLKGTFISLLFIFAITLLSQLTANIPIIKAWGFESVFFAVIYGLILNNCFTLPAWLKRAVNSEFYSLDLRIAKDALTASGDSDQQS